MCRSACRLGEIKAVSEGLLCGNSRRLLEDEGVLAPTKTSKMAKLPQNVTHTFVDASKVWQHSQASSPDLCLF